MAGGDIRFFHESLDMMPKGVLNLVRMVNGIISNLMHSPKPVVACVHGSVAGVGMSFMMAADLVIAGANTQFTMAYSKLGVSPDGGASYFLPKMVGHKKAMELALLSDVINANQAQDLGLINWVVPEDQLEEKTLQILNKLASGPTQAYANTKQLIYQSASNSLEQQFEAEARSFAHLSQTADFRSGVIGFLNKTKPEFIGK
jgi:2-(1,2-epoxy-1,2-dihydrophenyl)acetyl-CoA isomerase